MIIGLGNDIIAIDRIARIIKRYGQVFIEKIYTSQEIVHSKRYGCPKKQAAFFAKRFAAKEACVKALGTGIRNGIGWKQIEVTQGEYGKPELVLSGDAQLRLLSLATSDTIPRIHLALSDDSSYALATVVIDG